MITSPLEHLTSVEITEAESGIAPVDCLYVINLDERWERWEQTLQMCRQYGLHPNRVSAVNGWRIPEQVQCDLAFPHPRRLKGGVLGCLLSHLSVLSDAKQRNFDLIWVLEDDVEILEDPRLLTEMLSTLSLLDPEWDIFYTDVDSRAPDKGYVRSLGSDFRPGEKVYSAVYYQKRFVMNEDIMQIRSRFGTYSMMVSSRGVRKILDYFSIRPVWTAIDIDIHYIPGIRQYATRRDIVTNIRGSSSDTEEEMSPDRL